MKTSLSRSAMARPISAIAVVVALFTMGNALIAGCGGNKNEQSSSEQGTSTTQNNTAAAPSSTSASAVEMDGAKIYAEKCSVCHGPNGKGDGPGGAAVK